MKRVVRFLSPALVTVSLLSAIAPAGWADAYDDAMTKAIAARKKAGNDPSRWEEVLRLFEQADAIRSTVDSKLELAAAAANAGQEDLAVDAYQAAVDMGATGKSRDKALAYVKEHASKLAKLEVRGAAGAEVTIGAHRRGVLPHAPFVVAPGIVKVRVALGDKTNETSISVAAGGSDTVDLSFPPEPAPAASSTAPVVPDRDNRTVPIADTGAGARTLGWTLLGGGIGVLVGGVVIGTFGTSKVSARRDDLDEHCTVVVSDVCTKPKPGQEAAARDDESVISNWKTVRTVGWVGAGVGLMVAGVGLVRLLTAPSPPQGAAFVPHVQIGTNGAFVGLEGAL